MNTSLQGEGTYAYECRKQDCWHCAVMGLTPLPEIKIFTDPKAQLKPRQQNCVRWTAKEHQTIIRHLDMPLGKLTKLLPGRTIKSVEVRKSFMRRIGLLPKVKGIPTDYISPY